MKTLYHTFPINPKCVLQEVSIGAYEIGNNICCCIQPEKMTLLGSIDNFMIEISYNLRAYVE